MWKKILLGLGVALLVIQFIRPDKNLGAAPGPQDILAQWPAPPEVRPLLETACYDCHSNHTRYPWYAGVQPVGWWLASHIHDGKRHVNFSEFGALPPQRAARKLQHCIEEVSEGGMPLPSYTLIHTDARLSDAQRKTLADWFKSVRATLPAGETK